MSLDTLGVDFEIKAVDFGQRIISGWAAYHNNLDRVGDVIAPAASKKAVARLTSPSSVGVFIGHDMGRLPVGVPIKIEAQADGLYTETRIFDGPTGDDLLGAARGLKSAGQSLGLSIGYRPLDASYDRVEGRTVRTLLDYSLHEYSFASAVAIANPKALVTGVKTSEGAGMDYTVKEMDGRWHVMRGDKSLADFASEDEARAKCDALNDGGKGKTVHPNQLPDSAFLFVAPGGVLDDEGKTVPRSNRHFRYRDDSGAIDAEALRAALPQIAEAKSVGLDADELARLATRARRLVEQFDRGEKVADEPAEWKAGASVDLLGAAYRLIDLAERVVAEHKALAVIGEDSRSGWRLRPDALAELKSAHGALGRIVEHAALVAEGKDEEALAAWWQAQFDLLEVAS